MSIKNTRRLAPQAKLLPSQAYSKQNVVRGDTHELNFEIVRRHQRPLLSGDICEHLRLLLTIPKELKVGHSSSDPLTKQHLINAYDNIFNASFKSLPGEVHFVSDKDVVQAFPRNVPVALSDAVKA